MTTPYQNRYRPNPAGGEGDSVPEHRLIVERVLGKPLPPKAEVHHVDENKRNNANTNLVACEDAAYHRLLHKRRDALIATGNPRSRRCYFCKKWDLPEAMVNVPVSFGPGRAKVDKFYHRECLAARSRAYRQKKAAEVSHAG